METDSEDVEPCFFSVETLPAHLCLPESDGKKINFGVGRLEQRVSRKNVLLDRWPIFFSSEENFGGFGSMTILIFIFNGYKLWWVPLVYFFFLVRENLDPYTVMKKEIRRALAKMKKTVCGRDDCLKRAAPPEKRNSYPVGRPRPTPGILLFSAGLFLQRSGEKA